MNNRITTLRYIPYLITGFFILFLIGMSKSGNNITVFESTPPPKKQMNLIIAVDWSGSIISIPNFRKILRDDIGNKIVHYVREVEKNYYVDYKLLYFGLPRYYPSFRKNYLKFSNEQNWKRFISSLRTKKMGYLTALTLVKELALLKSNFSTPADKTELILLTDNILNGDRESEIFSFQNYNKQVSDSEKIAYFEEAKKLANRVNREFIFNEIENINFNGIYFRRFEVLLTEQLSLRHFLKFNEPLNATPTTYNTKRLIIRLEALERMFNKRFQLTGIEFIICDSLNTFEKKCYFPDSALTELFERKSIELLLLDENLADFKSLQCIMKARFIRNNGILKGKYGFVLTEPLRIKVNKKSSFLGIPINGYLLYKAGIVKSHRTLMILVWSFFGVVIFIWFLYFTFPYFYPPIPKLRVQLIRGGEA